ncbi:MAG TPA: outer membrane beta-barrel protein [Myxococcota bacterium]|jgi:hypothetical protein
MRPSWKFVVTVAAMLLAVPQLALADQVEEQLQQMQQRMTDLENKLQATNDELETSKEKVEQQQELIEKAGIDEARGADSGSPALEFLQAIEMDGFIASSWNYNFNVLSSKDVTQVGVPSDDDEFGSFAPSTAFGENGGRLGLVAPGHTNSNSFQLDQLWFGIGKPATMESNAGFRADIVWGALADANREGTSFTAFEDDAGDFDNGTFASSDNGTGDLPHIFQAYAEYLAPVGENGISFKGGRFATLIGAESFRQDANFNITRGIGWALQPVNHTGLLVSGKCSKCGLDWAIGAVNGYSDTMSDRDNAKGVIGGLKWSGEKVSLATNVYWGGDVGDFTPTALQSTTDFGVAHNSDSVGVLDAILTWNPSDRLSTWVNVDYYFVHDNPGNGVSNSSNIYTGSVASRYAITDATGIALRGEYQWWASEYDAQHLWSLTGTIDHALTENLIVKLEARYDRQDDNSSGEQFFLSGGKGPVEWNNKGQTLGLVQMLYKF